MPAFLLYCILLVVSGCNFKKNGKSANDAKKSEQEEIVNRTREEQARKEKIEKEEKEQEEQERKEKIELGVKKLTEKTKDYDADKMDELVEQRNKWKGKHVDEYANVFEKRIEELTPKWYQKYFPNMYAQLSNFDKTQLEKWLNDFYTLINIAKNAGKNLSPKSTPNDLSQAKNHTQKAIETSTDILYTLKERQNDIENLTKLYDSVSTLLHTENKIIETNKKQQNQVKIAKFKNELKSKSDKGELVNDLLKFLKDGDFARGLAVYERLTVVVGKKDPLNAWNDTSLFKLAAKTLFNMTIDKGSTEKVIQKAFHRLSLVLHPDMAKDKDKEAKDLLTIIYQKINNASVEPPSSFGN